MQYTHNNNNTIIGHLKAQKGLSGIDMGCIADYGSFYVDHDLEDEINVAGIDAYLDFYKNRAIKEVHFSKQENSLVTFFLQLTRYLQHGTIPAIHLHSYLDNIGEKLDEQI